jgi:N-acetylglucosamine kinase-like BadF-type ATPase
VDEAVTAVVIGLAGGSRAAADPGFLRSAVPETVAALPTLVSDLTVAFCSATPEARGSVLVAGTGAVSGRVVGADLVEQRDGWGWLLGDEGSGFWIGRAAVRAALADLQLGRPPGPLVVAVLTQARAESYLDLLQTCYAEPPAWLARFSPLVSRHAGQDAAAAAIAHQAAGQLEALLTGLSLVPGEPVVLAGSVLTSDGPVQSLLRERLRSRGLGPVLSPASGVTGALWIALRGCGVQGSDVHVRLVQTTRRRLDGQEAAEKYAR